MDLSPRAVIAGRYRVDSRVGKGGMGEVWLGESIPGGARVAVKTLLPAAALNHEVVARFKREAYLLGRIRSDNVARVVDFVPDEVYGLVLVMEFVEGDPLSRLLQERTLTVEEGIDLAVGLASALKDLHGANIIHRDLKPGNIIMTPMPDGRRRAVVVDFGVSRMMTDKNADEDEELTGITRADMAIGTIEYMAPEQILNSRNVTPGSDIYAAGAMLFRSCAGRHVFGSITPDTALAQKKLTTESPPMDLARSDEVAEGFAKVVAKMVRRRPSERYKTADEVLADLLPLREMAAAAVIALESTALDATKKALRDSAPAPSSARVASPLVPPASSRPPPSSQAPAPPSAAPVVGDRSSVTAAPSAASAPVLVRRGVSPWVTLALVAAALVGGVLLGPRVLQPLQQPAVRVAAGEASHDGVPAPSAATAAPAPPPATLLAEAPSAAPAPTPSAAAASPEVAQAAPSASATIADAGLVKVVPVRVPGPLPKPAPAWSSMVPTVVPVVPVVPTTTPPAPAKVAPSQL